MNEKVMALVAQIRSLLDELEALHGAGAAAMPGAPEMEEEEPEEPEAVEGEYEMPPLQGGLPPVVPRKPSAGFRPQMPF